MSRHGGGPGRGHGRREGVETVQKLCGSLARSQGHPIAPGRTGPTGKGGAIQISGGPEGVNPFRTTVDSNQRSLWRLPKPTTDHTAWLEAHRVRKLWQRHGKTLLTARTHVWDEKGQQVRRRQRGHTCRPAPVVYSRSLTICTPARPCARVVATCRWTATFQRHRLPSLTTWTSALR